MRRYKVPEYRDGGRVPIDDVVAPPEEPVPMTEADLPADDGGPLTHALAAHDRAEQMQREARASALDQRIAAIPGLTPHKQKFLRENPDLLRADVAPHVAQAHQAALAAGIADDTPEMNGALINGVVRAMQQQRRDAMPAQEYEPDFERPIAAPAAPRRSIPMSAPVSREVPQMSGTPRQDLTLSAEERDVAKRSFTDPSMSPADKELLYLKNRNLYRQMKLDGRYSDQGGG